MKTTVTIEDDVSAQLARAAQAAGVDVNKLVNKLVRDALTHAPAPHQGERKPFVQQTHNLGLRTDLDWDQALSLAGQMEDEHIIRKMREGQ